MNNLVTFMILAMAIILGGCGAMPDTVTQDENNPVRATGESELSTSSQVGPVVPEPTSSTDLETPQVDPVAPEPKSSPELETPFIVEQSSQSNVTELPARISSEFTGSAAEVEWELSEEYGYLSGFGPWVEEMMSSPTINQVTLVANAERINGEYDKHIVSITRTDRMQLCVDEGTCTLGIWEINTDQNEGKKCQGGTSCVAPMIQLVNELYPTYDVGWVWYGQFLQEGDPRTGEYAISSIYVILGSSD